MTNACTTTQDPRGSGSVVRSLSKKVGKPSFEDTSTSSSMPMQQLQTTPQESYQKLREHVPIGSEQRPQRDSRSPPSMFVKP